MKNRLNRMDDLARLGREVAEQIGCASKNNMIVGHCYDCDGKEVYLYAVPGHVADEVNEAISRIAGGKPSQILPPSSPERN